MRVSVRESIKNLYVHLAINGTLGSGKLEVFSHFVSCLNVLVCSQRFAYNAKPSFLVVFLLLNETEQTCCSSFVCVSILCVVCINSARSLMRCVLIGH